MEQISLLNQSYVAVMQLNGLYLIANVILLWMMFRGVSNANIYGANTFGKVLHSVLSLCVVAFVSNTFSFAASTTNNWALAVSETGEELTGGMQQFVDSMGATQYMTPGLIPSDPIGIVFVLAILVGLIGGMWTAPGPKE
jgi:hypothetical protein|tara:strand:+ start:425 stop:844 length:420 start_codon:yes stop_codon:yes gene_type:complete